MAFGQFVSSEPAGPGAFRFGLQNGQSVLMNGPAAEDLNKRIGASQALGPGALAAGPSQSLPPDTASDFVTPNPTAQAANMSVAPPPSATPERTAGGGARMSLDAARGLMAQKAPKPGAEKVPAAPGLPSTPSAPTQQAAAPAGATTGAPEAPQQPQGDVPLGYTMEAVGPGGQKITGPAVRRPDGSIGVYVPPSKGSPGGFTKLGQQTLEQHVQTEAAASTAEQQAAQAKAMGVDAEVQRLAAEEGAAEEAKWQAALQVQSQQDEISAEQKKFEEYEGQYAKLSEEVKSTKIDENQYMSGARGVFSALGMALGAFGAVLGKSPNFAAEFVQSQIDRNIRRQEAELATKKEGAGNALALLQKQTGNLQTAKATLRSLLTERTAADARAASLTGGSEQRRSFAAATAAELEAQALRANEVRQMSFREHLLANKAYYQQGRAGSSGGMLLVTLEQRERAQKLQSGAQDIEKTDQQMQIDRQKAEQEAAGKGPGGVKLSAPAASQVAQIDAALEGLAAYDKQHKEFGRPGVLVRGGMFAGDESKALTGRATALGPVVAKALEGDAATAASMDAVKDALLNKSGDQTELSTKALAEQLVMKRKALMANPSAGSGTPPTQ